MLTNQIHVPSPGSGALRLGLELVNSAGSKISEVKIAKASKPSASSCIESSMESVGASVFEDKISEGSCTRVMVSTVYLAT